MNPLTQLTEKMIEHERGVPQRVGHFLKVHGFAKTIGELEGLSEQELFILEAAALTHDIGIRPSLEKYQSAAGPHQQKEGPVLAEPMLAALGFEREVIDRVCYLIGHHHTYTNIDGLDYQILVEADFLVNLHEEQTGAEGIRRVRETIFKTGAGTRLLDTLFIS
jgi:hypothetical protein